MENNENLVTEEVTEKVEQTTEETVPEKIYTEDEMNARVNEILGKKIARREAKIRKEYDRKYGELESVLKAGTGEETVEGITGKLSEFYEKKGIEIPKKAEYSAKDIEVLAAAEAEEIIRGGFDEVVEEVDRLTELGVANMTAKEKAIFKVLAEHRQNTERSNELASIGVPEEVYNSKEFIEFASDYKSSTPIKKIYDNFVKTQNKKEFKTMGSMKSTAAENGVKDYYTPDEAKRFTQAEINKNPALVAAIERSMQKW